MANSWLSVHVKTVTRKCHCQTLIHTSMHSPWQQVPSHPADQHMGVYCFGSCMSLTVQSVPVGSLPSVSLFLDYINIPSVQGREGESSTLHRKSDKHLFWIPVCEKHSFHHKMSSHSGANNGLKKQRQKRLQIVKGWQRELKKGEKRHRAEILSGGRETEGRQERREQLARDKKHGMEGKTTSYYSN